MADSNYVHGEMDIASQKATWDGFITASTWGSFITISGRCPCYFHAQPGHPLVDFTRASCGPWYCWRPGFGYGGRLDRRCDRAHRAWSCCASLYRAGQSAALVTVLANWNRWIFHQPI